MAVRSAGALHRLLDALPVFEGDTRITTRFTLVPGSEFDLDALAALERSGARCLSWEEACRRPHDLVLSASPKGALWALSGPRVLLPHGAGFNKAISGEGSPRIPSGLDPHYLLADGEPLAALHALAHGDQLARLTESCPPAAARATVVGDPTLDRLLRSLTARDSHRAALGTGERRLIVMTSTWGPESLLARRPELPLALLTALPVDAYQFGLVLHPNEFSRTGSFDLSRQLAPALRAGLLLARPHEEWAALLVAADAVITDHGSTALYAAAAGRPVIGAYDGGSELMAGSPMAGLLARAPRLTGPASLPEALEAARATDVRASADAAFALPGRSLPHLRRELYRLLGLRSRAVPVAPHPFPLPTTTPQQPTALAVRAQPAGRRIVIERFPCDTSSAVHHLAAAYPQAGPRQLQSAAVLWTRADPDARAPHASSWTAAGWTARILDEAPGCRTAAAILTSERCLLRHRRAGLLSLRIESCRADGRVRRVDPAAVVSAVHAWLGANPGWVPPASASLSCELGPLTVQVELAEADEEDLDYEL
nr:translation initiation factor 2 [Kitasatospora azatica]